MSALGYVQFKPYVAGEATLDEVREEIKRSTRNFIRHQYNWFSLDDPDIRWFDADQATAAEIEKAVREWLRKGC